MGVVGQFHPSSPAPWPRVLLGPWRQNSTASKSPLSLLPFLVGGSPSEPRLCVWSHAAGLNSISSHSQVWAQGAGPGRERAPWLTNQDWYQCPFLTLNSLEALLWWWPCPLYCVTFPCITVNHTTQGKECLGAEKQEGSTEGHCPHTPPNPRPKASLPVAGLK